MSSVRMDYLEEFLTKDIMVMNLSLLPTIDESFYTNLVSKNNNNTQIVVRILEELNDAYV